MSTNYIILHQWFDKIREEENFFGIYSWLVKNREKSRRNFLRKILTIVHKAERFRKISIPSRIFFILRKYQTWSLNKIPIFLHTYKHTYKILSSAPTMERKISRYQSTPWDIRVCETSDAKIFSGEPSWSVNSIYRMIKHLTHPVERSTPPPPHSWSRERERGKGGESKTEQQGERGTARGCSWWRDGRYRMRQAEWPGYSSAETFSSLPFLLSSFLFSPPLFLSRKPTASPYKLPFVPLISPWPLVRTYLIRINARAAWKLASCPAPLLLLLSLSLSLDVVPLPCLVPPSCLLRHYRK